MRHNRKKTIRKGDRTEKTCSKATIQSKVTAREKYSMQKRPIQRKREVGKRKKEEIGKRKKEEIGKRKKRRGSRETDPEAAIQSEVKATKRKIKQKRPIKREKSRGSRETKCISSKACCF
jgi:hypothetical protein